MALDSGASIMILYALEEAGFITLGRLRGGRYVMQYSGELEAQRVIESVCSEENFEWSGKHRHWVIKAQYADDVLSRLDIVLQRHSADNVTLLKPQEACFPLVTIRAPAER
jgi:hypothetical protein